MPASRNGGRRIAVGVLLALSVLVLVALSPGSAGAVPIQPPWCGVPEPDAAGNLPGGRSNRPGRQLPAHPVLRDRLHARADRVRQPRRADGGRGHRPLRARPADVRHHDQPAADGGQRQAFRELEADARGRTRRSGARAGQLAAADDAIKVPIFIQARIHGNEYEGVDAIDAADRASSRRRRTATDPEVDAILDHTIAGLQHRSTTRTAARSANAPRTGTASTSTATT